MGTDQGDILQVGPELPDGKRVSVIERADGARQPVLIAKQGDPDPHDGVLELEPLGNGQHRIKSEIRFTSRGPGQVANSAYRSGWDKVWS